MSDEKRLKRLAVTPAFLLSVLQSKIPTIGRAFQVTEFEGIPAGAEVHHVSYDLYTDTFHFFLEHPSFDLVPQGEYVPIFEPKPTCHAVLVKKVEEPT